MDIEKIKSNMKKGQRARLFPVLSESRREERATSILLAVFTAVPDFARAVLADAGAPIGKKAVLDCFTEVAFKGSGENLRPDGWISISGNWAALVETKVGRSELTVEQVEGYLDIAKEQGFDAVITIGNQFAARPRHHPIKVNKIKTRKVQLFHFSWLSLISRARMLIESKGFTDREQVFMLEELVRYLQSEAAGITTGIRMSGGWRGVVERVHQNAHLGKNDEEVTEAVSDWFQLLRYLSIKLSLAVNVICKEAMPRKHAADPTVRLDETIVDVIRTQEMRSALEIPNAAGKLELSISLLRKTIDLSISMDAPKKEGMRPRTAINFVLNQIKDFEGDDLEVYVDWPKRVPTTSLSIRKALDEDKCDSLIPDNFKELPSTVRLKRVIDLGVGKLKSGNGLPKIAEEEVLRFYRQVVQRLKQWTAPAPKIKTAKPESTGSPPSPDNREATLGGVIDALGRDTNDSRFETIQTKDGES
ncbi:hypothetical protein [Thioalkalivibrio sp. HK1]|uniref:hypothetical protein n=1 Tax=Thioalkalivibrio sp. HK1 TaxID=1469245 RepID=UPI0012DDAC82|nr:hypothetical protein [Thioalkalivibrio sp. HK1]